jgi:hypothetical protein
VWNLLSNGHGGLDWAGLPLAVARLGITDIEALIDDLGAIKTWRPPGKRNEETNKED